MKMTKQENLRFAESMVRRVEKEWEKLNTKNGQIYEEIHQGVSEKGFNHIQEMNQDYLILSIKTQLRKRQLTVAQIEAGVYMPEINKDILQKKRRAYKQEIKHLEAQMIQYTGGINWSINS
tara:strand:- start:2250 stop:2612 length:363 start_codon:yes stop_codon:yes gene_type:complete